MVVGVNQEGRSLENLGLHKPLVSSYMIQDVSRGKTRFQVSRVNGTFFDLFIYLDSYSCKARGTV